MSIKSERINKLLRLPENSRTPRIIFAMTSMIYFFILIFLLKQLSTPQPEPLLQPFSKYLTPSKPVNPQETYRQLEHVENQDTEIFYYLYLSPDVSLQSVEKTAKNVRVFCKKPCIINFYNNLQAYILDRARSTIVSSEEMEKWNKQNYVFVAEHFLGYLPSSPNSHFVFQPEKDSYYNSLIK